MLIVLIGLDGDAGQSGIAGDVVGLPQEAVAGGIPALKQLVQIDLAAGGGEGKEIHVVYMDISVAMGFGIGGIQHEHLIELLGAFRAVFQHGAHGTVAVDVGVLPLEVQIPRVLEGQILKGAHEPGVHLPDAGTLRPVEDEFLSGAGVAVFDQHLFHHILHLFHRGRRVKGKRGQTLDHLIRELAGGLIIMAADGSGRLIDGAGDLLHIEIHGPAIPLDNLRHHHFPAPPTPKRHNILYDVLRTVPIIANI